MNVPLLRGRNLGTGDTAAAPAVALVDETMARQFWPGREPIGATLRMGREHRTVQIAGVVRESLGRSLGDPPRPAMFVPHSQNYSHDLNLIVRTEGPGNRAPRRYRPNPWHPYIRRPGRRCLVAESHRRPRDELVRTSRADPGGSSIYGVIAYNVSRRTREIGLRIALGARVSDVIGLVVRQALGLTLIGIGAGLILAMLATRVLARQ